MSGLIKNKAISASAGTGKTYALAVRYIRLIAAGASPETIAAMTFTRKAAGEILDRIITIICSWIKDPAEFEKMKAINNLDGLEHAELYQILYNLLMKIHKLQISTLDSFYVNIIQAFPFEFGLNGDFQIVDEADEEETKLTVLKEILWHETDNTEKANFLNEFKDATYGNEEKSILFNMKNFIDDHHEAFMQTQQQEKWGDLDEICGSAKNELFKKLDVKKTCEELSGEIQKTEFTDKQNEMWNAFISETESLVQPYKYTSRDAAGTFGKLIENLGDIRDGSANFALGGKRMTIGPDICSLLDKIVTGIIGRMIIMQEQRTKGMYNVLKRYEQTYDSLIRRSGLFTFSDVLHQLSLSLFDSHYPILSSMPSEEVDRVYIDYRLDSRYDHWLLDEFQDTSYLQWKVVENLIDEVMQDPSGSRSFFYVGDIKQSIYQWRSGDPRLFNAVYERFPDESIEKGTLHKSYRSNIEITDTVNKVFANIASNEVLSKAIPEDVIKRMEWQKHESAKGSGGFAGLIGMEMIKGESEENAVIRKAEIIAQRIKEIKPFEKDWSVAILLRQHKHTATFAKVLELHGIQATTSYQKGICDNPIVSAFLSLITLAEHPQDEFAWNHLQMTPFAKALFVRDTLSIELLDDIYNHGYKFMIEKWVEQLEEVNSPGTPSPSSGTKSNAEEKANSLGTPTVWSAIDDQTKSDLKDFINAAEMFDAGPLSSPHDFIDFVANYKVKFSSYGGSVQIMTIHGSKGLGFDLVFLPFNDKGGKKMTSSDVTGLQIKKNVDLSPDWAFMMPKKDIASTIPNLAEFIEQKDWDQCYENLCLLYVAITRAAKGLYMLIDVPEKITSVKASTVLLETLGNASESLKVERSEGGDKEKAGSPGSADRLIGNEVTGKEEGKETANTPGTPSPSSGTLELFEEKRKWKLPGLPQASWLYSAGSPNWHETGSDLPAPVLLPAGIRDPGSEKTTDNGQRTTDIESNTKSQLKINFKSSLKSKTPSGSEPYITYGQNLFSGASSSAMKLGTAVHELFEFLSWSDTDDYQQVISNWKESIEYDEEMQSTAVGLFESSLNSPEIFDALSRPDPNSELWREQDFSVIIDGEFINGSFDRTVINRDSNGNVIDAVIMDYKTDQAENDEELQTKVEIYANQLAVYSKVLAYILKIDESIISKKLLFVRLGKCVKVL